MLSRDFVASLGRVSGLPRADHHYILASFIQLRINIIRKTYSPRLLEWFLGPLEAVQTPKIDDIWVPSC